MFVKQLTTLTPVGVGVVLLVANRIRKRDPLGQAIKNPDLAGRFAERAPI